MFPMQFSYVEVKVYSNAWTQNILYRNVTPERRGQFESFQNVTRHKRSLSYNSTKYHLGYVAQYERNSQFSVACL